MAAAELFESSHAFGPFDHLRVPYAISATPGSDAETIGRLRSTDDRRASTAELLWTRGPDRRAGGRYVGRFRVAGFELAGQVSNAAPDDLLGTTDRSWRALTPVEDAHGRQVGSVWRNGRGDVLLPFDPGEVMRCLWSESYTRLGPRAATRRAAREIALRCYYLARPLVPRKLQMRLRRSLASRQTTPAFPAWPLETGLHDMYDWLLALAAEVAGAPVPWIRPWPDGADWAFVLTHDVETARGRDDLEVLRAPERSHGYRSSWNFVPERYTVPKTTVDGLLGEGCEVGVHGLKHDGKDLASSRMLARRLPAMHAYARQWGAVGFRSPATQRGWALMPSLGFDYDSSYTDTDPYEPQPGGCCTYLPFFNKGLVELPITLPQDHTLFEVLGHSDGSTWLEKSRELRRRGGMVLVLSHPDYATGAALAAWHALLDEFAGDRSAWQALPREVSEWWRERAASTPCLHDGQWTVSGPAAGRARLQYSTPRVTV